MASPTNLAAFEHEALSVTQALNKTNQQLSQLGRILVVGEISQLSLRKHWYFTLKDDDSAVDCMMFVNHTQEVTFNPQLGQRVLIVGMPVVYPKTGKMQLRVDIMQLAGLGRIMEELKAREAMLRAEGWFAPERKRPLPRILSHVAVVTSCEGRVIDDIIYNATQRNPLIRLTFFDTLVQGPTAPQALVAALACAYQRATAGVLPPEMPGQLKRYYLDSGQVTPNFDAIIVGRGGGSFEDLLCFSDADVVRMVGMSPVPIISAVGHDEDRPLCDYSADLRVSTPTAAAVRITPITWEQMRVALEQLAQRAHNVMLEREDELTAHTEGLTQRLDTMLQGLLYRRLQHAEQQLSWLQQQAQSTLAARFENYTQRILRAEGSLTAHNPERANAAQAQRLQAALYRLAQVPAQLSALTTKTEHLTAQLNSAAHALALKLEQQHHAVSTVLPERLNQALDYQVLACAQRTDQAYGRLEHSRTSIEHQLLLTATKLRFELSTQLEHALLKALERAQKRCSSEFADQLDELIAQRLMSRQRQLNNLEQRCARYWEQKLTPALRAHESKLATLLAQLTALNPFYQLQRGLSITTKDGVHSVPATELKVNDTIITLMLGYEVTSKITALKPAAHLQPDSGAEAIPEHAD